mmetsp:Transcript_23020/g.75002  ORF Transcript_23020/g.75002 Transcript_23020/m.75002 type:complete len:81 (-) Transcript_23020:20-262(-)
MLGDAKVGYWTVDEAKSQQISNYQLGTSSCGPCSVLNAVAMIGETPTLESTKKDLLDRLLSLVKKRECDEIGSRCRHHSL